MQCLKCRKDIIGGDIYGLHPVCYRDWFQPKSADLHELRDIDPKSRSAGSENGLKREKDTFYHGKYRKYSARISDVRYILKVQEDGYPDLPEMEFVCNQIASLLKLKVPPYYLIRLTDREITEKPVPMTFVTRNFMQDYVGTLNHLYKFLPKGSKNYNCENIVKAVFKQTDSPSDVARFVEICLFDALIGNNDRHGRNLGIIDTGKKRLLSPVYDNPSYFAVAEEDILGADINPSGAIWTSSTKEPKIKDYIREFERLNLQETCAKFTGKAIRRAVEIKEKVGASGISKRRKEAFLGFLNKRLQELADVSGA